jgi:ribosomal protein L35AE/L33A
MSDKVNCDEEDLIGDIDINDINEENMNEPNKETTNAPNITEENIIYKPSNIIFSDREKDIIKDLVQGDRNILIHGAGGSGKCFGKDTPVLMYDGTVKMVQDIKEGDKLMGDDSKPRNVLSISRGREQMYKISNKYGDSYIVNESHILSFKNNGLISRIKKDKTGNYKIFAFNSVGGGYRCDRLKDFKDTTTYKTICSYISFRNRTRFNFHNLYGKHDYCLKDVIVDINLGRNTLKRFWGYKVPIIFESGIKPANENIYTFENIDVDENISSFRTAPFETREMFITKYIMKHGTYRNDTYTIQCAPNHVQDLKFISNSCGYLTIVKSSANEGSANEGSANEISINDGYGAINMNICKFTKCPYFNKDCNLHSFRRNNYFEPLVHKLKITRLKEDDYYGFTIDGNRRFLLENFCVVHNTVLIKEVVKKLEDHYFNMSYDTHVGAKMPLYSSEDTYKPFYVTSYTGSAAINVGGMTLHKYAGIGIGSGDALSLFKRVDSYQPARSRWRKTQILIIDEISMVGDDLFTKLDFIAKKIRNSNKPFGGIKLIASGDFLQLPPIKDGWVFNSDVWKMLNFKVYNFKACKRFNDKDYYDMLLRFRDCSHTDQDLDVLRTRLMSMKELEAMKAQNKFAVIPTILYSTRIDVYSHNMRELKKLPGEEYSFEATDLFSQKTNEKQRDYYKKLLEEAIPEKIILKIGSQVMLKKNLDMDLGLVNGSRGVIVSINENSGGVKVKFKNNIECDIFAEDWEIRENKHEWAVRAQMPLILAWSITCHKSQGITIDSLIVDLGPTIFENSQAYVALSRVRNLKDMYILNFEEKSLKVDAEALEYVKHLEKISEPV